MDASPFDRYYALFGFLAGVRDSDMPVIHPCRGLPVDCCPEVRRALGPSPDELRASNPTGWAYEWNGLFGHSWATGAELIGYDFARPVPCPRAHGDRRPDWQAPCGHEATDPEVSTVGEVLGGWVDTFHRIAALMPDPSDVRVVYAFDN
jgi:hypothetical protein